MFDSHERCPHLFPLPGAPNKPVYFFHDAVRSPCNLFLETLNRGWPDVNANRSHDVSPANIEIGCIKVQRRRPVMP